MLDLDADEMLRRMAWASDSVIRAMNGSDEECDPVLQGHRARYLGFSREGERQSYLLQVQHFAVWHGRFAARDSDEWRDWLCAVSGMEGIPEASAVLDELELSVMRAANPGPSAYDRARGPKITNRGASDAMAAYQLVELLLVASRAAYLSRNRPAEKREAIVRGDMEKRWADLDVKYEDAARVALQGDWPFSHAELNFEKVRRYVVMLLERFPPDTTRNRQKGPEPDHVEIALGLAREEHEIPLGAPKSVRDGLRKKYTRALGWTVESELEAERRRRFLKTRPSTARGAPIPSCHGSRPEKRKAAP